jgi:hypothetical protein
MDMRSISVLTHDPTNRQPTEAEIASMGKLIAEGMQAGWLIECEGVHFGTKRVVCWYWAAASGGGRRGCN